MTTLRKEAFETIKKVWKKRTSNTNHDPEGNGFVDSMLYEMIDELIELRGFSFLATDEDSPEYKLHERQEELREHLAENDVVSAIILGRPVGKALNKQAEIFELEEMINAQLTRLRMNWNQEDEKEKDKFRKFLKDEKKEGRALEKWVDWWLAGEWRPGLWNLPMIRKQWLKAFTVDVVEKRPEYQKFVAPAEDDFIPNPKAKK